MLCFDAFQHPLPLLFVVNNDQERLQRWQPDPYLDEPSIRRSVQICAGMGEYCDAIVLKTYGLVDDDLKAKVP
jgi:hypothetical protein